MPKPAPSKKTIIRILHPSMSELPWVEISKSALRHNISQFHSIIDTQTLLGACIKANAYGHGLLECAGIFLEAGADWLCVNALYEAQTLRTAGITAPIYIMGYVPLDDLQAAVELDCRLIVYNSETVKQLGAVAARTGKPVRVHIKVETGSNRQGILPDDIVGFARLISSYPALEPEGLATHFANIEDTTDHSYAELQLQRLRKAADALSSAGISIPIMHCANSAAAILFPQTHFHMVRLGISCYGMWPSPETYSAHIKKRNSTFTLKPAFTWKTRIAQIKTVPAGDYIGYGCTYKTLRTTRLAILPVGYYDGYDRGITGGYVLIRGKRAPLRGRICMNIIMVDITDIPEACLEDVVVLIGCSGQECISAELMAQWAGTINYEITTRVNERIPRLVVD